MYVNNSIRYNKKCYYKIKIEINRKGEQNKIKNDNKNKLKIFIINNKK